MLYNQQREVEVSSLNTKISRLKAKYNQTKQENALNRKVEINNSLKDMLHKETLKIIWECILD